VPEGQDGFVPIRRSFLVAGVAVAVAAVGVAAGLLVATNGSGQPSLLCREQARTVAGGGYVVQNNEFDSTAPVCVVTRGGTDFRVRNSAVSNSTDGFPAAYPSIYQGCHWGRCSSGGLAATPVQVADLTPGTVTTSWSTTQPASSGSYYVAYDVWFNRAPTATGQPDCAELMVWLGHNGPVQPFGTPVASDVTVAGHAYDVWAGQRSVWSAITYEMTTNATAVSDLDLGALVQDAVGRGYLPRSCYLISVEAGFGLWHGGAGLATRSFSVRLSR
jgi:Glycosyl hydrolase family 12